MTFPQYPPDLEALHQQWQTAEAEMHRAQSECRDHDRWFSEGRLSLDEFLSLPCSKAREATEVWLEIHSRWLEELQKWLDEQKSA